MNSPPERTAQEPVALMDAVILHAQLRPQSAAYVDAEQSLSYGQLLVRARRGAAWLVSQGVAPGQVIALPLDQNIASARRAMELFYAAMYLGAGILPLYPDVPLAARIEMMGRFGAHWVVATDAPSALEVRVLDPRGFDPGDVRFDVDPPIYESRPEAPSVFVFTSGTTGAAKVFLPTQAQILSNSRSSALALGFDATDRHMTALNWPSGVGLRYMLRSHAVGAAYIAASLGETRAELAAVLARFNVTRVSASPWQVRRLVQSPPSAHPLPGLRSLQVIGAFISPDEIAAASQALTPNVYVGYGANELGSVSLLHPGEDPGGGCVGRLLPGFEVRIALADGRGGQPGETGELGFRAPWLASGYVDHPAATRERFREGWFYPGDVGTVDAQNRIYLKGRSEETINYGGLKIWPADIESVLKLHPEVLDAALVGAPDRLAGSIPVAFLVTRTPVDAPLPTSLSEEALRGFCLARIDGARVPVQFILVAEIPRSDAGKIMRDVLAMAYEEVRGALREQGR